MKKLLIFDCDGTLVDTIQDVAICFNGALEHFGFPTYPIQDYGRIVGGNLETIVSRLLPEDARTVENIDNVKTKYRALYSASDKPNTKPFAGIVEALDILKAEGFVLSINTNKGQALTDALIEKVFKKDLFTSVVGYEESRPSKPDPYGVEMICSECNIPKSQAVYIGDGRSDINTAHNAQIPCVFVTWGQGTEEDSRDPRIAAVVNSVRELTAVLMQGNL